MALEGFRIYSETADDVLPFGPATDVVLADGTTGAVPTAGFATDAELAAHIANLTTARVLMSPLPSIAAYAGAEDIAYFVYLGYTLEASTPKHVEFQVTTAGSGAQTAEVGFFSSPLAPNKASQSLTKLVSTGTVDDLTTTGMKRNTSAFSTSIPAGKHLWAGLRTAMAGGEPSYSGLGRDHSQGFILSTATAGALTGTGPWTGAIVALTSATISSGPELRAVYD